MPAQLPVPGVVRVSITGTASGVNIANVFHWQATDGGGAAFDVAGCQTLANGFGSAFDTSFAPKLGTVYVPGVTTALDLTNDLGVAATRANTGAGIGTAHTCPQSAALCVTWRISRHYRGGHPRTYFGPLPDSAITNPTTLDSSTVTSWQSAALAFMGLVNALTPGGRHGHLVCVHRWRSKAQLVPPQTTPIDTAAVDNRIDSQRRRLGPDR